MAVTQDPRASEPLTVLLLDDHPDVLVSLVELLETDPEVTVVATASRVPDAVREAARCKPKVAVIDVSMPDGGGWAAARGLLEAWPEMRLVAYSSYDEALVTRTMMAAGVSAFVSKGSEIQTLLAAIHGEKVMPEPWNGAPLLHRTGAAV
jgi:DNA-binding NarL/FixJ family response regulator